MKSLSQEASEVRPPQNCSSSMIACNMLHSPYSPDSSSSSSSESSESSSGIMSSIVFIMLMPQVTSPVSSGLISQSPEHDFSSFMPHSMAIVMSCIMGSSLAASSPPIIRLSATMGSMLQPSTPVSSSGPHRQFSLLLQELVVISAAHSSPTVISIIKASSPPPSPPPDMSSIITMKLMLHSSVPASSVPHSHWPEQSALLFVEHSSSSIAISSRELPSPSSPLIIENISRESMLHTIVEVSSSLGCHAH
mmetsp:Transcript_5742/g.19981  ORF Transcript_5742/g.19981 Transcript_5742/m.19981 type:complete len:250 (+) Transcript_5742:1103-1852(+)